MGGRKKKLKPSVASTAASTPGPLCHTDAQRKTASNRSRAIAETVSWGKSLSRPMVARTTKTAAG
jgi:hypothetical protein